MKKFSIALCAILICGLLTGCGSGSDYVTDNYAGITTNGAYAEDAMYYSDSSYDSEPYESDVQELTDSNAKRIYTGRISLESVTFYQTVSDISDKVTALGGYFEDENIYTEHSYWDSESYNMADMTIRVPVEKFDELVNYIDSYGNAAVVSRNINTEDVSESYYDLEMRLDLAQAEVDELEELLEQAETVQDIITVRDELQDAVYRVESLQGQLNHYDSLILYSYLYLDIKEVTALTMTAKAIGYGNKLLESLSRGFSDGVEFFGDLLLSLASNWLVLIVLGVVIFFIVRVVRRRKRKKAANAAKPVSVVSPVTDPRKPKS